MRVARFYPRATRVSRSPRFRLCSPKIRKKTLRLQANPSAHRTEYKYVFTITVEILVRFISRSHSQVAGASHKGNWPLFSQGINKYHVILPSCRVHSKLTPALLVYTVVYTIVVDDHENYWQIVPEKRKNVFCINRRLKSFIVPLRVKWYHSVEVVFVQNIWHVGNCRIEYDMGTQNLVHTWKLSYFITKSESSHSGPASSKQSPIISKNFHFSFVSFW